MITEYPEPDPAYYVVERFRLAGGADYTEQVAGPFNTAEDAGWRRYAMQWAEPWRRLSTAET